MIPIIHAHDWVNSCASFKQIIRMIVFRDTLGYSISITRVSRMLMPVLLLRAHLFREL